MPELKATGNGQPFKYHYDEALGYSVHDKCGGPAISSIYEMYCLRCRPDLLKVEHGVSRWVLRWLRDNGMLDQVLADA